MSSISKDEKVRLSRKKSVYLRSEVTCRTHCRGFCDYWDRVHTRGQARNFTLMRFPFGTAPSYPHGWWNFWGKGSDSLERETELRRIGKCTGPFGIRATKIDKRLVEVRYGSSKIPTKSFVIAKLKHHRSSIRGSLLGSLEAMLPTLTREMATVSCSQNFGT